MSLPCKAHVSYTDDSGVEVNYDLTPADATSYTGDYDGTTILLEFIDSGSTASWVLRVALNPVQFPQSYETWFGTRRGDIGDDPSDTYTPAETNDESLQYDITVTTSDSCSSDSDSGSGSYKSSSSVSESDSSSGSGSGSDSGSGCPCYMVKILVDGSIRCIELTQTVDDYGNAYFGDGDDIVVSFFLGTWGVSVGDDTYQHEDDNDGDCPNFGEYTALDPFSPAFGSTLELVRCDSCSSDSDSDSGSGSVSGSVSESDSASGSGSGSSP